MKYLLFPIIILSFLINNGCNEQQQNRVFYKADNPNFQYTGRINFSNPLQPRFWSSGTYIKARFKGDSCKIIVNDQELYGNNHNYIEIVIDDKKPFRIQTEGHLDTITVAKDLGNGEHEITICKDTESGIGYLEFLGMQCSELLSPPAEPSRKMEFIGNSITCGTGSDLVIPCDSGQWYDQQNAYMSYGPATARALNAKWTLSSVSGIGMIHSCCNMNILMPQVFDKLDMRDDSLSWDFSNYQPDVVTICLGQNDGIQDSTAFCSAYVDFIKNIRSRYPKADIICLSSPMADSTLRPVLKNYLIGIVNNLHKAGDQQVYKYFFSQWYHKGCGGHPDMEQHQEMAKELAVYIKRVKDW